MTGYDPDVVCGVCGRSYPRGAECPARHVMSDCKTCNGRGRINNDQNLCPECKGRGTMSYDEIQDKLKREARDIKVPPALGRILNRIKSHPDKDQGDKMGDPHQNPKDPRNQPKGTEPNPKGSRARKPVSEEATTRRSVVREMEDIAEDLNLVRGMLMGYRDTTLENSISELRHMRESEIHDQAWVDQGIDAHMAEQDNLNTALEALASFLSRWREATDREKTFFHRG